MPTLSKFINNVYEKDIKNHINFEDKKLQFKRRDELYKKNLNINSDEKESAGEKRLKLLIHYLEILDNKGYKRSQHQLGFHKAFIGACLKKILKDDYNSDLEKIIQKYDIENTTNDIIITTPRRFGKTISVALFVAAYLLSQPQQEVSIYSTGRRASSKLLQKIRDFVILMSGSNDTIMFFRGEEILQIKGPDGKPCVCGSYPSAVAISIKSNPIQSNPIQLCCGVCV